MSTKYTREVLAPIVEKSISIQAILRALGLRTTGGSHAHIKALVGHYGLSISHFKRTTFGRNYTGGRTKKPASEVLVCRADRIAIEAFRVRRALLEIGRVELCDKCHIGAVWNGAPLTLQIDHINGLKWDNRPENIRFMCPNCHSQTNNFGSKNKARVTE